MQLRVMERVRSSEARGKSSTERCGTLPGGYGMREVLGGAKAIVASTKKVGGPGTRLDVPITHVNASYVRSHFDSMESGYRGCSARGRNRSGTRDDDWCARACTRRRT